MQYPGLNNGQISNRAKNAIQNGPSTYYDDNVSESTNIL